MCRAFTQSSWVSPLVAGAVGPAGRPHPAGRGAAELRVRAAATRVTVSFARAGPAAGAVGRRRRRLAGRRQRAGGRRGRRRAAWCPPAGLGATGRPQAPAGTGRTAGRGHALHRCRTGLRRGPASSRRRWTASAASATMGPCPTPRSPLVPPTTCWPRRSSWPAPPPSRRPATRPLVGEHLGVAAEPSTRRPTRSHAGRWARCSPTPSPATLPGYAGWHWAVTVARGPRRRRGHRRRGRPAARRRGAAGPGVGALARAAAPRRPLRRRRAALHRGRPAPGARPTWPTTTPPRTPRAASSPRSSGWAASGSCRPRAAREAVEPLDAPATSGPRSAMARHAPGPCATCGFFLPLAGSLRQSLGPAATPTPRPTAASSPPTTAAARTARRPSCVDEADRGRPHRPLRHRRLRRPVTRLVAPRSRRRAPATVGSARVPDGWPSVPSGTGRGELALPAHDSEAERRRGAMAATQVQVHIRSTRSPSTSSTTSATAHSADADRAPRGRCPPAAAAGPAWSVRGRAPDVTIAEPRRRRQRRGVPPRRRRVARCRRSIRQPAVVRGSPAMRRPVASHRGSTTAGPDGATPAGRGRRRARRRAPRRSAGPQVRPKNGLDRYFEISARRSTFGRELRGGLTTFFTMAYIVVLNPIILSGAGRRREHAARSPRRRRGHRAGRRRHDDPHGRRRPVPVRAGHRPGHQRDRRGLRGHPAVLAGDHGPGRARGPADHRAGAHRLPAGGVRGHPAAAQDRHRGRHRLLPDHHRARRRRRHPARAAR